MQDKNVLDHINSLTDEERELLERGEKQPLGEAEHARLRQIEVMLDQCWDLLRQRRARREFGRDPEAAHVRSPDEVERYLQ